MVLPNDLELAKWLSEEAADHITYLYHTYIRPFIPLQEHYQKMLGRALRAITEV